MEGNVTVTFTGLEALRRRLEERNQDQTARKKFLEDEVKQYIPAAAEVELANQPDWASSAPTLVAEFKLKIPGWASSAGHRELLPVGLFSAPERHLFDHSERVQPIYMEFPSQRADDVTIELPAGWQVGSLPAAPSQMYSIVGYALNAEDVQGRLHLRRTLRVDFLLLDPKYYPALRNFFHMVKAGDEEQVVLQAVTRARANEPRTPDPIRSIRPHGRRRRTRERPRRSPKNRTNHINRNILGSRIARCREGGTREVPTLDTLVTPMYSRQP